MQKGRIIRILVLFLCFCTASPGTAEEVKLSLDFELREPENVIFNSLRDIATDSNNNIYVLDSKEKVIYLFNEAGIFQKSVGRAGQGPGEFQRPIAIYINAKNIIHILDERNRRVEIFDSEANHFRSITFTEFPIGGGKKVITDKKGNLYISGYYKNANSVLAKYSSTGELLKHFLLPIVEYSGVNFTDYDKQMLKQNLCGGTMCFDGEERLIFSYQWPYIIKSFSADGGELIQFSTNNHFNWTPLIFEIEPNGMLHGESTRTRKIFLFENEYIVNSIYSVDWIGNPRKKISQKDIPEKLDKYFTIKRNFAVLDFYTRNGKLIGSAEVGKKNEKIYFLTSDNKGRILGVKLDDEGIQTIVRYNAEVLHK